MRTGNQQSASNLAALSCVLSPSVFTIVKNDRYVPGSPIFREEHKTPPITPAPPSTPRSRAKGATGSQQHIQHQYQHQNKSQNQNQHQNQNQNQHQNHKQQLQQHQHPSAMTVSVTHATQGAAVVTTKSTAPTHCYASTRSAAMMALAMGQRPKSSASVLKSTTTSTTNKSTSSTQATTIIKSSAAAPANLAKNGTSSSSTITHTNGIATLSGGSGSSGSDNDGFNNSTSSTATALRRLYFKSGRSAKSRVNSLTGTSMVNTTAGIPLSTMSTTYHDVGATTAATTNASHTSASGGVPKVVIMGSSSASMPDTNINTSTDSASTLVTSVTHTDTSETCDSLDLGDNSGQSEPLFSSLEEPLLTAIQIDSEHDGNELELTSCSMYSRPDMNLQDSTESQESSLSILVGEPTSTTPLLSTRRRQSHSVTPVKERQPNTAPAPSSASSHFTFDLPLSPKSARFSEKSDSHFTFKDSLKSTSSSTTTVLNGRQSKESTPSSARRNLERDERNRTTTFMEERRASNCSATRRENSPNSRSKSRPYGAEVYYENEQAQDLNGEELSRRSKKSRGRDSLSSNSSSSRNRYSTSGAVLPSMNKTSPKREPRRSPTSSKVNSAPPTMKDSNFFGSSATKPKQLSPTSQYSNANQRKYSSSSSSGGSERERVRVRDRERDRERSKDITMFPFDREALDYERIQRECFAVDEHSSSVTCSSESDEAEHCSVYERKLSTHHGSSPKSTDIFQQYTLLTQQEQQQQRVSICSALSGGPPSRKNSKRIRPESAMSQKIGVPKSDAFYPQPKSSTSPGEHSNYTQHSPKSYMELNKFDEIASKFDQIPPKHVGSNANLSTNQQGSTALTTSTIMNNNQLVDGSGALQPSSNNNTNSSPTGSMRGMTPPPPSMMPDLRVDFFTEAKMQARKKSFKCKLAVTSASCADLDECQRNAVGGGNASGSINVTSNPLEAAVCTQPRATIVVQQPSLSLDSAVETLLIKSEGDFISVEHGKDLARKRNSQQLQHPPHHAAQQQQQQQHQQQQQQQLKRDENMRQLLDVTNTLTFEELRDFEMRYGSPHHSRSQSVKTPGSRASGRPNQLCLPQQRSRVASMPNTGVEEEYYRLRHFSITGKGIVNRGDSLKSRRSRSNNSVASSNSSTEHLTTAQLPAPTSARTSATCSLASSRESSTSNPGSGPYRVLMLGSPAVGKSSLVSQFMTSEYLHAYDTSIDDESGEKAVSVLLSGEESELIFIDHAYTEMTPDDCLGSYDPHGYCVIYSASDRSSFNVAEHVLQVLWTNQNIAQKAVILVGNKADLARSRTVTTEEGKAMATAYDCKFIETSVGINHNVDELLVGLLSQIRLKLENPEKSRDLFRKRSIRKSKRRACSPLGSACLTGGTHPNTPLGPVNNVITDVSNTPPGSAHSSPRKYRGSRTSTSLKVKGLLGRVWARDSKSKSCENLHVL